jgi:hypothetical protein
VPALWLPLVVAPEGCAFTSAIGLPRRLCLGKLLNGCLHRVCMNRYYRYQAWSGGHQFRILAMEGETVQQIELVSYGMEISLKDTVIQDRFAAAELDRYQTFQDGRYLEISPDEFQFYYATYLQAYFRRNLLLKDPFLPISDKIK